MIKKYKIIITGVLLLGFLNYICFLLNGRPLLTLTNVLWFFFIVYQTINYKTK